jgi:hypothetical protein
MAFHQLPCIDVMGLVGKHVVEQRQAIRAGFWKHNGSNIRLVNNQIKNIVLALEKRGKCIHPKQAHPKTQYKYVSELTAVHHGSGTLYEATTGMHVGRPEWSITYWGWWVVGCRYKTAEDYIVDKTIECQRNPCLTWALPAPHQPKNPKTSLIAKRNGRVGTEFNMWCKLPANRGLIEAYQKENSCNAPAAKRACFAKRRQ